MDGALAAPMSQVFVCKALLEEQACVQVYDPQVKREQMFIEFDYTCGVNKDNTPKLEEMVSIITCFDSHAYRCVGRFAGGNLRTDILVTLVVNPSVPP